MTVWVLQAVWPAPCKMYAHLPWLLGSGLAAETVGGMGGKGRVGQDGGRERGVDALRANTGGRGRGKQKELERCIHY